MCSSTRGIRPNPWKNFIRAQLRIQSWSAANEATVQADAQTPALPTPDPVPVSFLLLTVTL
jgi:hypothetical protein